MQYVRTSALYHGCSFGREGTHQHYQVLIFLLVACMGGPRRHPERVPPGTGVL